jgi:hypothetical protein
LPDLRQWLRQRNASRLLARTGAHLSVIVLLAVSSAFGFVQVGSPAATSNGGHASELAFISAVRGASISTGPELSVQYDIQADPLRDDPMLSRKAAPTFPPTPGATPVKPGPATPEPPSTVGAPQVGAATASRNAKLLWPLPGGVITQYYHAGHLALDIAGPAGHRVNASESGVVVWAGWRNNGGGYVVQIDHGNGLQTAYNHLGAIWVSVGQKVARGEGIAAVGCTGDCTGPHVHFEVIVGGVYVNPLRYL